MALYIYNGLPVSRTCDGMKWALAIRSCGCEYGISYTRTTLCMMLMLMVLRQPGPVQQKSHSCGVFVLMGLHLCLQEIGLPINYPRLHSLGAYIQCPVGLQMRQLGEHCHSGRLVH